LAKKLNEVYGRSASRTNILNKLARASFSLTEFIQIINAYGYEISLKETGEGLIEPAKADNSSTN